MPERVLRPVNRASCSEWAFRQSESTNAREGIKTIDPVPSWWDRNAWSESTNAREGIKTTVTFVTFALKKNGGSESTNAREGIKTDREGSVDQRHGGLGLNQRMPERVLRR